MPFCRACLLLLSLPILLVRPAQAGPPRPAVDRYGDPLPAGALARLGTVRFRHGNTVCSIAFSPAGWRGGEVLASGGRDQALRLWDPATGKQVRELPGGGAVLAFSPDGTTLAQALGGQNQDVVLWEARTGKELRRLADHRSTIRSLAFSPDGRSLAAAGWGGSGATLRLWDVAGGKQLWQVRADPNETSVVAFAPDGKTLASAGTGGGVCLRDPAGKEIRRLGGSDGPRFWRLAFSPDGKRLAAAGGPGHGGFRTPVVLWDLAAGKVLSRFEGSGEASALSPDGRTLAERADDNGVRIRDVVTGKELRRLPTQDQPVQACAFSPDGRTLATAGGPVIRLWDVATGKEKLPRDEHRGPVLAVALSPDGRDLVSLSEDGTARRWDPASGRVRLRLRTGSAREHWLDVSPDGRTLASVRSHSSLRLWDAATGKERKRLNTPGVVGCVAFSPDGKALVTGENRHAARLWDLGTSRELRAFEGHEGVSVTALAYSPAGPVVASSSFGAVHLWDAATGREVRRLKVGEGAGSLAFSPDGRLVAAVQGPAGMNLLVWEVATGERCWRFQRSSRDNAFAYGCVTFSPDGRALALGCEDGVVYLWELGGRPRLRRLTGHRGPVGCLAFSADGRVLVSGSSDTTVLLWDATFGRRAAPSDEEMQGLWEALASADAERAYRAVWSLAAAPRQAVPFLRRRLAPASPADGERIARLVRELDSDDFKVREAATARLRRLEAEAEPALRRALASGPSAEVRARAGRLLERLRDRSPSADHLRGLRVVAVLEQAGTPEARQALEELARRRPGSDTAQEAKASLRRLARRPAGSR